MKKSILWSIGVAFVFVVTLFSVKEAQAIPAFARKYKTSCATCHTAFARLTPFGEAFRRNGYQFPGGTDLEYIKEEPVNLGAEGNKRAFPDAIWPSSIPGTAPFSLLITNEFTYANDAEPKIDFASFPSEVGFLAGGTLGESIAFYSEIELSDEGVEVERVQASLLNMFGPRSMFNLKIGRFEPGVFFFSNHRRYGPKYFLESATVGDNQWSFEPAQQGFELFGTLDEGRLAYNLGVVEGSGNIVNTAKDVYAHATYKVGGMRLDGVAPEGEKPFKKTRPWEDNSFVFGAFVYQGHAKLGAGAGPVDSDETRVLGKSAAKLSQAAETQDDDFTAFGGDAQIFYGRWNLFGGIGIFDHDHPFLDDPTRGATATIGFGEVDFVAYPWLFPWARYESFHVDNETVRRFSPGFTALLRANVKVQLFAEFVKDPGQDFDFETLEGSLLLGF
ncbi:MAG: hypothetical protein D6743_04905 [Calditrichaeota bacterium]|nr:MAG: hypothetical protein D6743_04905 [Calditrichota bacterium]